MRDIDANSMGAIAPRQKVVRATSLSRPHRNFVVSLFETVQEAQLLLGDRATRKHAKDS